MDYSVLMTVYKKEKPEYLKSAIESMLNQTVAPAQFVLVCDGPLTEELDETIESFGDSSYYDSDSETDEDDSDSWDFDFDSWDAGDTDWDSDW